MTFKLHICRSSTLHYAQEYLNCITINTTLITNTLSLSFVMHAQSYEMMSLYTYYPAIYAFIM